MDRLEDYIRNNRDELDKYTPSADVWERIKNGSVRSGKGIVFRRVAAAAVIVVILGSAALFYLGENRREIITNPKNSEAVIMKANPILREIEIYYNTLYNNLFKEATPLLTAYPDMEKELVTDMSQIDSICVEIKSDLRDNVSNQEVIEALINNYRTKIRILEDMLNVLKENENNNLKGETHEL
jgi:hypothetical protein